LGKHNQHPFAITHPPLKYDDRDRARGWDIELDSEWMIPLNQQAELAFCKKIRSKPCNASITDLEELKRIIIKAADNKETCVSAPKNRKAIVDRFMYHLAWHPTIVYRITWDKVTAFDIKAIWKLQVQGMHDLCRELGEQWAWEYLWKNWYT
jgi:hypothetical protein